MASASSTASSPTSSAPRRSAAKNRAETYAKRFAAKEACAKALGTGMRRGVWWRDMGVVNLPSGRPTMQLTGGARSGCEALTPAGYEAQIDLTITDEGPMALAFVVISAVPARSSRESAAAASDAIVARPDRGGAALRVARDIWRCSKTP